MKRKKTVIGLLSFLLLLLGWLQPFVVQAAEAEQVRVQVAGLVWQFWAYNVKAAVSRLDFAPPINEMKVDLEEGTLEFIVRVGMHLDKEKLKKAIEDAGYRVGGVEVITLGGREGKQ